MAGVLITGVNGFVGGFLGDLLHQETADIYGTCLFSCEQNRKIPLHQCNIENMEEVFALIEKLKPDKIYHLAAMSSVSQSFHSPRETMLINTMGTLNILESVRKLMLKTRILVIGSSNEYGNSTPVPITEKNPVYPPNPYAVSKYAAGEMARMYWLTHKVDTVITRSFNHTGAGQPEGFVIPDFCRQIAEIEHDMREPVIRVGNIDVKRDFLDVRDVVSAYQILMNSGKSGEIYNVCSGQAYSIREILDTLLLLAKRDIKVESDESLFRKTEIAELYGDCEKLKSCGWDRTYDFKDTLKTVLDFWRKKVACQY